MTTPTSPEDTLELPRSQATAIDPWADYAEGRPPAVRAEVVPTRWAVTPPPAPRPPRARRARRPARKPRPTMVPLAPTYPAVPGYPAAYGPPPAQGQVAHRPVVLRPPAPRRHVASAYALWLFLGALGAHRFYVGRPLSGVAYLLLLVLSPFTLFLSLPVLALCLLVDVIAIPPMVRRANRRRGWAR